MTIEHKIKEIYESSIVDRQQGELKRRAEESKAAQAHYDLHSKNIHKLLDDIKSSLEKHAKNSKDIMNWGTVGTISSIHDRLRDVNESLNPESLNPRYY